MAVSTSCSTLHVPYSLEPEAQLDDQLRSWLAFGEEKVKEVVVLARALSEGRDAVAAEIAASNAAAESRRTDPRLNNGQIRARLDAILADGVSRGDAAERRRSQDERLRLPTLPTTTIGSFPQTVEIRKARQALTRGEIDDAEYVRQMRAEVANVIALQEKLGLDVLVHGEPERNDMVQYFAEQLDGFFATQNGWVQSYGSRCVRPPILYGDVARRKPMTVEWATYAQSLTQKHVKGMLTGPVTILAWSFVRDDQPLGTPRIRSPWQSGMRRWTCRMPASPSFRWMNPRCASCCLCVIPRSRRTWTGPSVRSVCPLRACPMRHRSIRTCAIRSSAR